MNAPEIANPITITAASSRQIAVNWRMRVRLRSLILVQSLAHLAPPDGLSSTRAAGIAGWTVLPQGNAMAIRINAQVTGYGPQPGNTQALVIVTVEFDGPSEAMTFTVLVPNDGDEGVVREQAIARAQDLARRFADLRRSSPPPP